MKVSVCHSLAEISAPDWNALGQPDYPFTRHAFLYGLEQYDCLEPFGWHPVYIVIHDNDTLIAALPCYIKTNSYGELVFDHVWAQAYQRSGIDYYPKLVTAIPYTPATGERFLLNYQYANNALQQAKLRTLLCQAARTFCDQHQLSSWHILFAEQSVLEELDHQQIMTRCDIQFHWQNRNYDTFDDFLATLTSRKRKNIKKERKQAQSHGFDISIQEGHQLDDDEWRKVHALYQSIYDRKYGTATLSVDFFRHLGRSIGQRVLVVSARDRSNIVAASLFFRSDSQIYGRVWGCESFANNLHFECCYYRGIEYCIENQLDWFDPGAQGEHKLSRGFLPTTTWSGHWISNQEFGDAIRNFLNQEVRHIEAYRSQLMQNSPYRNDNTVPGRG